MFVVKISQPVATAHDKRHVSLCVTHPADAGQSVEPAERQDGEESDDVYVKEGLHHRRFGVAFRFYRRIRISHV